MLLVALCTILTAVALPSIPSLPVYLLRSTSLSLLVAIALAANAASWSGVAHGVSLYGGLIQITYASLMAQALLYGLAIFAMLPWSPSRLASVSRTAYPTVSSYSLFALASLIGGSMLVAVGDLVTLYLALELQSFAVYVLATIYRSDKRATHSGLLYFMLGGLSSCLLLLGMAIVYYDTGATSIEALVMLVSIGSTQSIALQLGAIAMGVGILFKVTAAPFHHWGPDVYDGVPTIVTTWIAVLPKVSLLTLLLALAVTWGSQFPIGTTVEWTGPLFGDQSRVWSTLLLASGLLSMLVGTIVGLVQTRVKRLLAYSTIAHMGFLLLALAITSNDACSAYVMYVVQYTVTSVLSFSTVLAMGYTLHGRSAVTSIDVGTFSDLRGSYSVTPALGFCLALTLLSMAGVPPLVGFYAKQAVLTSAVKAGYVFLSVVGVVTSVISAAYYLHLIRLVHFESPMAVPADVNRAGALTPLHSYTIAALSLWLFTYTLYPDLLLDTSRLVALTLYST